jgi:hypothetical protein
VERNKFLAKLFVALIFGVLLYQDKSTEICKKRKEKESVKKSLEESRQKKHEQYKDLTPEERKSWSNLHFLEMVYSNKSQNLLIKNSLG